MNPLVKLKAAEKRLDEAVSFYKQMLNEVRYDLRDKRLTFKDVAGLTEYDISYLYRLDIPFDGDNVITYNRLEKWISRHKPSRMKRLQNNFNQRFEV